MRMMRVPARDIFNLPHFSRERHDIRSVTDELERSGAVQVAEDAREIAVIVDLHKRTGIRQRRIACVWASPYALGQPVQLVAGSI